MRRMRLSDVIRRLGDIIYTMENQGAKEIHIVYFNDCKDKVNVKIEFVLEKGSEIYGGA